MKSCYQGHMVAQFCAISNISVQSVELFIFSPFSLPALVQKLGFIIKQGRKNEGQNTHLVWFIMSVTIIDLVSTVQTHFSFLLSSCSQLVISLNQMWTEGSIEGNSADVFGYQIHWSDIFACSGRNQWRNFIHLTKGDVFVWAAWAWSFVVSFDKLLRRVWARSQDQVCWMKAH